MVRVELSRRLEAAVAERVVRPVVERIAEDLREEAARRAPDGSRWETAEDERVRLSHAEADGQVVPDNLRFRLPAVAYVRKGRGRDGKALNPAGGWKLTAGWDLARRPGDPDLPLHQRVNCRCRAVRVPGAVASSIVAGPAVVEGARVTAQVWTEFPRAAESEFGTGGDRAARFMRGALEEVSRRYPRR